VKKHEGGAAKSGSGSSDNQNTSQQLLSQVCRLLSRSQSQDIYMGNSSS
jgi:hypothetical protein